MLVNTHERAKKKLEEIIDWYNKNFYEHIDIETCLEFMKIVGEQVDERALKVDKEFIISRLREVVVDQKIGNEQSLSVDKENVMKRIRDDGLASD
jgi:hypothetical protein